ncbi:MAG: hypothetical protein ACRES8_02875 [Nevskiaceae bacterium]
MKIRNLVMAGLLALGAAGVAIAGADGERRVVKHKIHGGASVEFTAMHNIMAELLSAKTGKTQAEINALFEKGGPHEVAEALDLKREDMRELMKEARGTLITRAQAANLITAAQAEKLRAAKIETHHKRVHKEDGDED